VLPGRPQNIIGLNGREALGPRAFERIAPHLANALRGAPSVFEFTDEDSGRRIRVAFTPDEPVPGTINGVYILSMDVTEEAQARAALAQTHKRELAAQLTSGLAHDFANLLTIILGLQSRLGRMDGLPEGAVNLVQGTIAAARRGGALLDRIGSISGRRELRPEPVNVARLLDDLRVLAEPTLAPDTRLAVDCAPLPGALMLDPGALQDALLNVILNARDAVASGGAGGAIRVVARPVRDTWLEFTVTDSGPGFSPEALKRGLDPFFTTKGEAGSGLGLAMVYDQVKLAGGSVRLGNAPGGGAVVTLRLPLRRAEPAPAARLVLLVEDTEELRAEIREYLRDLGHAVIEATSAEEALALADLPEIDMVLSDINLPGGRSGLDLAQALRAGGHGADLRLMTALPPGDATRATAAAAFPVLAKPFGRDDLARFIGGAAA
jgi:signal transduction histidine kinase